ncbi:ubiquitin-fold modifier-conjugating enzyme 1 isoform X2 [Monodelphis domestica]|uniref:ubiquitin-fold modifier-conjugating enzyme 1 isoform X2 n=1 Tax=Monodelphis domestica TaxID=13616 RepID=UPI0024E19C87|nr:ubiquitin-fold modifier-conjugating enzyme 1 isoform X2 [Monodelphis domestica]
MYHNLFSHSPTDGPPLTFQFFGTTKRVAINIFVQYVENNKKADNDWFRLESNKEGTRWFGKCWYIQDLLKYEFDLEFDIPITYPSTAPEIAVPELDGKTAKMYRGGKICLTEHFKPLWARNVPKFGLAHLMALGLGPWLAVEIPDLIQKGIIQHKEKQCTP